MKILFQGIPNMLFIPVYVLFIAGIALAAVLQWKRRSMLYWITGISLLFFIFWRMMLHIVTSRYAVILIIPAVIASSYFCFRFTDVIPPAIIQKKKRIWHWLPYILISALTAACIGKCLHYNPYEDYLVKIANLIKQDAANYRHAVVYTSFTKTNQIRYYSGITASPFTPGPDALETEWTSLRSAVMSSGCDVVYFVLTKKENEQNTFRLTNSQWQKMAEYYTSRKKNTVCSLYKMDMRDLVRSSLLPFDEKTKMENPNEQVLFHADCTFANQSYYEKVKKSFQQRKEARDCPVLSNFPAGWNMDTGSYFAVGSNPVIETLPVLQNDEKSGRYLHLKADSMCNIYSEKSFSFRGRYCLNMIVSGKEGSRFGFAINVWNEENGRRIWKLHTILPVQTIPKENQKYVCSFSIPPELYEGYDVFTPYIVIHEGDINVYKYYVTKQ